MLPIHELFGPVAFLIFMVLVTVYLFIISGEDKARIIVRFVNTPLSVLAISLSLFSAYYIYDQSKLPDLELEVKFIPLPGATGTLTSQLGGIYELFIENVGDRDAVSPWMSGGF